MSALGDMRVTLAAALDAVTSLQGYANVPGQVNVPAAVVAPDSITYDTDFEHGATYRFPVQMLVGLGDWASAQKQMDGFVSHDGTAVDAINDSDLEARVVSMEDYGITTFGDTNYLGARLIVEVLI